MNDSGGLARESTAPSDVVVVYDGDCPLCRNAAFAWRIKEAAGRLELVDARREADHTVMRAIAQRNLDLDEGMVVAYGNRYYHGGNAIAILALLGSEKGWFNRLNRMLFGNSNIARLAYPVLRSIRNLLLRLKGVSPIGDVLADNAEPLFKRVFGKDWDRLPNVFKLHYAPRRNASDSVTCVGRLDVDVAPAIGLIARMTNMLVPYTGRKVPVTVTLRSGGVAEALTFDRRFDFPKRAPHRFVSTMHPVGGNELVEVMRFGIGWKLAMIWEDDKVKLEHRGYIWQVLGFRLPLPLNWLMGEGYAEEWAIGPNRFAMWTHAEHPWFGPVFGYRGEFEIETVACPRPS